MGRKQSFFSLFGTPQPFPHAFLSVSSFCFSATSAAVMSTCSWLMGSSLLPLSCAEDILLRLLEDCWQLSLSSPWDRFCFWLSCLVTACWRKRVLQKSASFGYRGDSWNFEGCTQKKCTLGLDPCILIDFRWWNTRNSFPSWVNVEPSLPTIDMMAFDTAWLLKSLFKVVLIAETHAIVGNHVLRYRALAAAIWKKFLASDVLVIFSMEYGYVR